MRAVPRAALGALIVAFALPTGAAVAQVQQSDPNAANASLARQSDMRALQQQRTSDFNTSNMQGQRNVQYRPDLAYGGIHGLRRGDGHHEGVRPRGGFNTGVCVGC